MQYVRVTSDAPDEAQYEPAGCVVIHEVDVTLRSLIRTRAMPGVITDVEFAAPTRDWAARRNAPTVIRGMRERAELYGGVLTAGPREQRGFAVTLRLPISKDGS